MKTNDKTAARLEAIEERLIRLEELVRELLVRPLPAPIIIGAPARPVDPPPVVPGPLTPYSPPSFPPHFTVSAGGI